MFSVHLQGSDQGQLAADVLTLRQPWGALIVCGAKTYEATSLPCPSSLIDKRVAIRAAKTVHPQPLRKAAQIEIRETSQRTGIAMLPHGTIVGTAMLRAAWRAASGLSRRRKVEIDGQVEEANLPQPEWITMGASEALFDHFRSGRWLPIVIGAAMNMVPDGNWLADRIKWSDLVNGFGFVAVDGNEDIYLNRYVLSHAGIDAPQPDQPVESRCTRGPKGQRATEVRACGSTQGRRASLYNRK